MLILRPHLFTLFIWVVVKQLQATAVHSVTCFRSAPVVIFLSWSAPDSMTGITDAFNRNFAPNFVFGTSCLGPRMKKPGPVAERAK